jgi:hypothetical protein
MTAIQMQLARSLRDVDHSRCSSDVDAVRRRRDALREEHGRTDEHGRPLRWRVRPCRQCGGFYIVRELRGVGKRP